MNEENKKVSHFRHSVAARRNYVVESNKRFKQQREEGEKGEGQKLIGMNLETFQEKRAFLSAT